MSFFELRMERNMSILTHTHGALPLAAHDSARAEQATLLTPSRIAAGKRLLIAAIQVLGFFAALVAVMAVKYAAFFLHFPRLR